MVERRANGRSRIPPSLLLPEDRLQTLLQQAVMFGLLASLTAIVFFLGLLGLKVSKAGVIVSELLSGQGELETVEIDSGAYLAARAA